MRDKRKRILSRKAFLNRDGFHSDANIVTSVSTYESERSCSVGCYLTIKDCNDKISLSIEVYDSKSYRNTIFKLNKLIEELEIFRAGVEEAREWLIEAEKGVSERNKKAKADEKLKGTPAPGAGIPQGVRNRSGVPRRRT